MPAFIDMTGHQYGRWTVLSRAENNRHNQPQWLCRCSCGTERVLRAGTLRSGDTKSCGCIYKDADFRRRKSDAATRHGNACKGRKSSTYLTWCNLGTRKHHAKYNGITVCDRWRSFENFLADMGERPSPAHTIDRIDNSKGYEPGNCRWATMKEQQNNRTNNRIITFQGKSQTLMQWSEQTGFPRKTISRRLDLGWSVEQALTIKPRSGRNQYDNRRV